MNTEIVTVKDLIDFLENNFNRDDYLAFYYDGGAYTELDYISNPFIGDNNWMFNYVKDKRQYELDNLGCREEDAEHMKSIIIDNYKDVTDNDIVMC